MEDDLPTEYDVVVVGTGIDSYHDGGNGCPSRLSAETKTFSPVILAVMISDRYDRVHRRRGGKQNWQESSTSGQVTIRCLKVIFSFLHLSPVNHPVIVYSLK